MGCFPCRLNLPTPALKAARWDLALVPVASHVDIVDRRYEKETSSTLILTGNTPADNWDEFFEGDSDTLV